MSVMMSEIHRPQQNIKEKEQCNHLKIKIKKITEVPIL